MAKTVDVLIPTCNRPAALAVTLTSLCSQSCRDFDVIVSDQSEGSDPFLAGEVQAVLRLLRHHGHQVTTHRHLPRRGMAEHRQFLLSQSAAPYVLFLDDDLILEPYVVGRMADALREENCGFVGMAVHGLSFLHDVRPQQQAIEFWSGPVQPEEISPLSSAWERHHLHSAANLLHVQQQLGITPERQRKYRVAWVGACVMYDAARLRSVGAFNFWSDLPAAHCGEDVLAQLRVMARHGGCGLIPSGAYHQELPTTLEDRRVNAPCVLDLRARASEPKPVERGIA